MGIMLLLVICVSVVECYDAGRARFIAKSSEDSPYTNFLFRGSEPVNGSGIFEWDLVTKTLENVCQSEGNCTLPSNFYFVDIKYARRHWL